MIRETFDRRSESRRRLHRCILCLSTKATRLCFYVFSFVVILVTITTVVLMKTPASVRRRAETTVFRRRDEGPGHHPPENLTETFRWQRAFNDLSVTHLFSAHHDPRGISASIVLIGISDNYRKRLQRVDEFNYDDDNDDDAMTSTSKLCRIWFDGEEQPVFAGARFDVMNSHHGRRWVRKSNHREVFLDKLTRFLLLPECVTIVGTGHILTKIIHKNDIYIEFDIHHRIALLR